MWLIDRETWDYHIGSHKVPYYHNDRLGCILRSVENMFGTLRVQEPICIVISEPENHYAKIVACNESNDLANGSYSVHDEDSKELLASLREI